MNMATATNAAAIAISNTQSPSIGNANVEGERENLRYLGSHGAQHRAIEFRNEIVREVGSLRRGLLVGES